jgi:hypothetical protein
MNTRILQQFLASLKAPLQSLGAGTDIESLIAALEPFAEWDMPNLTMFLRTADEYRRDGRLPVPSADDASLERLRADFAAVRDGAQMDDSDAFSSAQARAAVTLKEIASGVGLTVAPKVDKKWLDRRRDALRVSALATRLRGLADRITSSESYLDPIVQSEIQYFADLKAADWSLLFQQPLLKSAAKATGNSRVKTLAALAYLAGHSARKAKPAKSKAVSFPKEQIDPYVQRLQDRLERSIDRDLFPRSEVDVQIAELADLGADMLREVLKQANVPVGARDAKPRMLEILRSRLDASHRAFEKVQA